MAIHVERRRLPLTHVFVDVALPSANGRVSLIQGIPGTGLEIGALGGPPEILIQRTTKAFESETHSVPLAYDPDTRGMTMKFGMREISGINLKLSSGGVLIVEPDGSSSLRFGSGNPLEAHSWLISWETRPGTGEFEHAMIYNGIVSGDVSLKLSRSDYTEIAIEIVGQPILTRPANDNLGYSTTIV